MNANEKTLSVWLSNTVLVSARGRVALEAEVAKAKPELTPAQVHAVCVGAFYSAD